LPNRKTPGAIGVELNAQGAHALVAKVELDSSRLLEINLDQNGAAKDRLNRLLAQPVSQAFDVVGVHANFGFD
jgi:hypothetical protein